MSDQYDWSMLRVEWEEKGLDLNHTYYWDGDVPRCTKCGLSGNRIWAYDGQIVEYFQYCNEIRRK